MSSKNKELFETLHTDYHPMVFQMCLGFVKGDTDLAKDLSQEVFINTWNALNKFKEEASYKTWIYRTTVNTCLKYFRDKKDKNRVPISEAETNLHEEWDNQETVNKMYKAIGQLNEIDRLIIMMVLDELGYDEISKVMGISQVNLRVKIHRIKKNLKDLMQNGN